ncbi:MAG TPA: restriction endonuclease [Usitatibacter sp.]|jgi:restriction system protein|nr:restriction endonuclease [Usitatibacter sp.]
MARRRHDGALTALLEFAGTLPPLAGLALAAGSYFLLHWWADVPPTALPADLRPANVVASAVLKGLLLGAQYVFPAIFLMGALASAIKRALRRAREVRSAMAPVAPQEAQPDRGPRNEHDIYRIWTGDWEDAPGPSRRVDTSAWNLELLRALEWKRFEELCAAYFRLLGFRTLLAKPGPDGGVDIHLIAEGDAKPGVLVQCKAWSTYDVGVKCIRELLGVMAAEQVREGVFVTTGRFTQPARDFAGGKEIMLIDGPDLLRKIDALADDQRSSLLALATAGDFTRPTCPSCGVKMVRRIAKASGDPFWGCENFPGCRTTLRIAAEAMA